MRGSLEMAICLALQGKAVKVRHGVRYPRKHPNVTRSRIGAPIELYLTSMLLSALLLDPASRSRRRTTLLYSSGIPIDKDPIPLQYMLLGRSSAQFPRIQAVLAISPYPTIAIISTSEHHAPAAFVLPSAPSAPSGRPAPSFGFGFGTFSYAFGLGLRFSFFLAPLLRRRPWL